MITTDAFGQALSTDADSARVYDEAVVAIMCMQEGTLDLLDRAIETDPNFALAHATKAALDFEMHDLIDSAEQYRAAVACLDRSATPREIAFVHAVGDRIHGDRSAYRMYVDEYPDDPMGLTLAMPTIAFSGAFEDPGHAWHRLDDLVSLHGDAWWFTGLYAYAKLELEERDIAIELAEKSLRDQPLGATAAHARTHLYYECGDHAAGAAWLSDWIDGAGHSAVHRAHFSWHVAMHDLGLGDTSAALSRYDADMNPRILQGTRSLVDSVSLLWRLHLIDIEDRADDITQILQVAGKEVSEPSTAFTAMHSALAFAASGDAEAVARIAAHCRREGSGAMTEVVAPFADSLIDYVNADFEASARGLIAVLPRTQEIGASRVQCEVIEDTALASLIQAGRLAEAQGMLGHRLDRREHRGDRLLRQRISQA
jgi:tetratricopeptide (TPR) repeat protein